MIAERLTQGNTTVNNLLWQDMRRINFNCAEGFRKFEKPVLIIRGTEDIVKESTAYTAAKYLKNYRVVLMDHCVHYGWLDNPQVYFNEVNSFLKS